MANERIEIDIVLNDGSIAKGFAKINNEAQKSSSILKDAFSVFGGIQLSKAFDSLTTSVGGFFKDAIKEALEGERAVTALGSSLKSAGTFSESAVKAFENLAEEIQNTTKYSDDQVLSAAALARNFTKTNLEAAKLTKAAVQLSSALGQDLETSVNQLGGTFTGTAGRLARTIPGLGGLTEAALKSGAALDFVIKKFPNAAENEIKSFGGALQQAKNQFNNFLENIGNTLIKNPTFLAAINGLKGLFGGLFGDISKQPEQLKSSIDSFVLAAVDGLGLVVRAGVEVANNINNIKLTAISAYLVFLDIKKAALDITNSIGKVTNLLPGGLSKEEYQARLDLAKETGEEIKRVEALAEDAALKQLKYGESFNFVNDQFEKYKQKVKEASLLTQEFNDKKKNSGGFGTKSSPELIDQKAIQEQRLKLEEFRDKGVDLIDEIYKEIFNLKNIDLSDVFESLGLGAELAAAQTAEAVGKVAAKAENFKNTTLSTTKQIATFIQNGLTNAIVGGIDSLVTSIVNGENAFRNFGNTILGIIGDLAKQIGAFIIAAGVAKLKLFSGNPFETIAAGVALVAIGSALSAISKKGSQGGFAGAAAPGSSITPPGTPAQPVSGIGENLQQKQAGVQIIVQGNIFDSDATGMRIANLLKDQGFSNAVVT